MAKTMENRLKETWLPTTGEAQTTLVCYVDGRPALTPHHQVGSDGAHGTESHTP